MITFTSSQDGECCDVYVMRANGGDQTNLTNSSGGGAVSAWSPDGRKIVYLTGDFDVHTMNADGSNKVRLTRGPAVDWWPDWQPLPGGDCHDRRR